LWPSVAAGTCSLVAVLVPLSAGATAMRLSLVAVAAAVALVLVRAVRREAARADVARVLAREADHRIKNDLQTVIYCCSTGPTAATGRGSAKRPRASARSRPCTGC
jgi:hypothetical protein